MGVFDRLRQLPIAERAAALSDEDVLSDAERAAVRSLLEHDSPTEEFLGAPVERASCSLLEPLIARCLPSVLHGYKILKPVGRGSFGTVFLAEQSSPRRLVAIKLLPAGADESQSRRFQFEAQALARLNHPNVAGVLELAVHENQPYLVMEYVDGVPLNAFAEAKSLGLAERIELLIRICDGVVHVHQRGVLHRDLAPKNILVTASGVPKIVDFGLAIDKALRVDEVLRITLPGSVIGTLRYVSPEQLAGDAGMVDERSDLYSLGVIAFELLVGAHPYLNEPASLVDAVQQLAVAPNAPISGKNHGIPRDLHAVLRRAIDRDPARRYQTAADFGEDLRRVLEQRPVAAVPWSWKYRSAKFCARNRRLVVAAGVAMSMIVLAVGSEVGSLRREAHTRNSALTALDIVVNRLLSPLGPRIGTLDERERLLVDIEPELLRMQKRSPGDARVLKLCADYQIARSDIHRDRGRDDASLAACAEAVQTYERLYGPSQAGSEISVAYSTSLAKLGDAQRRLGQIDAGMASYRHALEVDEASVRARPDDLTALNTLYWSLTRFAEATGVKTSFDQAYTDRAWDISNRMQEVDPDNWRSLETLVHSRFGRYIRQPDGQRDVGPLMEAEAASARLVAADPDSAVHNSKRLLILTDVLKLPPLAVALPERDRCLTQALEVETRLVRNQGETRVEDRVLIQFRARLMEIAAKAGDDVGVVTHCEQFLEHTAHCAAGGFGTSSDVEAAYYTLRTIYLPSLLRADPDHAQGRYQQWHDRLSRLAAARFPRSEVTAELLHGKQESVRP
ncbi:MAG: serine/threonine protein kinase [Planctomycetes bacterium]|nr:serine/threonine protein kinase [Planctomycetota bacterium]